MGGDKGVAAYGNGGGSVFLFGWVGGWRADEVASNCDMWLDYGATTQDDVLSPMDLVAPSYFVTYECFSTSLSL